MKNRIIWYALLICGLYSCNPGVNAPYLNSEADIVLKHGSWDSTGSRVLTTWMNASLPAFFMLQGDRAFIAAGSTPAFFSVSPGPGSLLLLHWDSAKDPVCIGAYIPVNWREAILLRYQGNTLSGLHMMANHASAVLTRGEIDSIAGILKRVPLISLP
jgi:hypothetical protein